MKVGSLFSGIAGADLGFERAGFEIAWQCEKESFAQRVLLTHFPGVPLYPDVTEIGFGKEGFVEVAPVDVIVGGFP